MPCLSVLEQWGALETCTSRSRGEATSSMVCFPPILLVSWVVATCGLVHRDRADDAGAIMLVISAADGMSLTWHSREMRLSESWLSVLFASFDADVPPERQGLGE